LFSEAGENTMRTFLSKLFLAPVVMAAAALATNPAMAATTVKVPFSFTVAGKDCPAGSYSVARDRSGNLITLTSLETSQRFQMVAGPGDSAPAGEAVLHFNQDGSAHTLSSIQYESLVTPRLDKKGHVNEHNRAQDIPGQ
jgi:hypothetical protein